MSSSRISLSATVAVTAAALLTAGAPTPASAQGFGIYEQSACAMGRGGAAVARPCGDGSSVFFNPAGLLAHGDPVISGGLSATFGDGAFEPDGGGEATPLDTRSLSVPHLFLGFEPTPEWGLGVGLYAPYGLETTWPRDFEGRFVGYDNALRTLYLQPTMAWQVADRVEFGVGFTGVWSELVIRRHEDLARVPVPSEVGVPPGATFGDLGIPSGTEVADVTLDATSDGFGLGAHLGLLVQVTERLRAGVRYLTSVEVEYDGTADFEPVDPGVTLAAGNPFGAPPGTPLATALQDAGFYAPGGPLADQGIRSAVTLPSQLVAGVALDAGRGVELSLDWQRTGWQSFDTVRIEFDKDGTPDEVREQGYDATSTVRVGLTWDAARELALRGGYVWNQAAAPDRTVTPFLPEASRHMVAAGFGWDRSGLGVDVGYMYIAQEDRRGRVRNPPPGESSSIAMNSGIYRLDGHLFALTLTIGL